jgi:hypothetical protein
MPDRTSEQEILRLWKLDNAAIAREAVGSFGYEQKKEVETVVLKMMGERGEMLQRTWEEGAESIYGGEFATLFHEILLDQMVNAVEKYSDRIHQKICVDGNYCEKRKTKVFESEGWTVAAALADSLLACAAAIPVPITTVSFTGWRFESRRTLSRNVGMHTS